MMGMEYGLSRSLCWELLRKMESAKDDFVLYKAMFGTEKQHCYGA
jgi:hypothetical protein